MTGGSARIVVGYDGSIQAAAAVDWAAAEAARRGVRLTVLHAADYAVVLPGALPTRPNPFEAAATGVTRDGVERARSRAPGLDVDAETHVARVAPALVQASKDAQLLVVGSRGHGEVTAALLGSVAFAVTAEAACPVVVVRGATGCPGPERPVVVGVDRWPAAQPALRFAAETAAGTAAPLLVVSAYRAVSTESGAPAGFWALEASGTVQFERLARQLATETVAAAVADARDVYLGLDVRPMVLEGRPPHVLTETARTAGLLVVGAHGEGGFAGLRLGSIAHAVLHDASCPVVVVRGDGVR